PVGEVGLDVRVKLAVNEPDGTGAAVVVPGPEPPGRGDVGGVEARGIAGVDGDPTAAAPAAVVDGSEHASACFARAPGGADEPGAGGDLGLERDAPPRAAAAGAVERRRAVGQDGAIELDGGGDQGEQPAAGPAEVIVADAAAGAAAGLVGVGIVAV